MPRRSRPHSFLPRRRRELSSSLASPPPPSKPPETLQPFAHVCVADFVDVPSSRFADSSFPPQHKLTHPPSYDFFSASHTAQRRPPPARAPSAVVTNPQYFGALPYECASDSSLHSSSSGNSSASIDSNVYVIENSHHLSNLLTIVAPSKQHQQQSSSHRVTKPAPTFRRPFHTVKSSTPVSEQEIRSDETDLYEGHLEDLRFQDATSDETDSLSREIASEREEVSSTCVTDVEPFLQTSPQLSDSPQLPVTRYFSPRTESDTSLFSQSSIHAPSLTDLCTIRSVESSDELFRLHSRSHSPLITRVESLSADDAVHSNRNLMCQNPASPTKYTFKPTYRRSSRQVSSSDPSLHQPVPVFQAERHCTPINPQLSKQEVCHRKSYSFSSLSSQTNSEPLTLAAIKKAVDIIDPRVVFSIAQSQSLAFAAAGLFRKKRDSEETFNSSCTEYYEDDYTRFLEKKHCLSPSRLTQHPYICKMMNYDGWSLRSSKVDLRSDSTLSIPTSDEHYFPAS